MEAGLLAGRLGAMARDDPTAARPDTPDLRAEPPPEDPWAIFGAWYREAAGVVRYPHAATLATVGADGGADARVVLVHRWGPEGLLLSTDRQSPKASQMTARPSAALVFYWGPLDRQVRFRGSVSLADEADADACFEERPRGSRITAWVSRQGRSLLRRADLDAAWASAEKRFEGVEPIPRPPHWRAYRLIPDAIELWQASAHRLHDRLLYRASPGGWRVERLWP